MKLERAMTKLKHIEQEAEERLAIHASRFSSALADRDFAALFLIERAFLRDWQRREAARSTLRSAQEVLPELN